MSAITLETRLWAKVEKGPSCWLWGGALGANGYGQIGSGGRLLYVHRLAYELTVGPIPDGHWIDHLCRVRRCVNPRHLQAVTPRENTRRGVSPPILTGRLGRCARGHQMTPENVYVRPATPTRQEERWCRRCMRERDRRRRRRRAAA